MIKMYIATFPEQLLKRKIPAGFQQPQGFMLACMQADLKEVPLTTDLFGTKFDVVLIDPPWEEYVRRSPGIGDGISWSWQDIRDLDIGAITDIPSFVFLW